MEKEEKGELLRLRRANEYYSEITRSCLVVVILVFWYYPALARLQNARKVSSINAPPGAPLVRLQICPESQLNSLNRTSSDVPAARWASRLEKQSKKLIGSPHW